MCRSLRLILLLVLCLGAPAAMAIDVHVAVDTKALPVAGFVLAFDLVDGGPPANGVTLTHLTTDGAFGTAKFTGDAAAGPNGTLRLGGSQFFNEILLSLSSATRLDFDLDMPLVGPAPGALPDAFTFFLLDRSTLLPLVETADPSGAQALFTVQSGDSPLGPFTTFANAGTGLAATWTVVPAVQAVPEPASLFLMLVALAALMVARGARRSLVRCLGITTLVLPGLAAAAVHVTPGGGTSFPHDGAKWETAYSATELPTAISSNPGGEFWLAKGGYGVLGNIPDGTQLYGGFVGGLFGETMRSQRDPAANFTSFNGILMTAYDDGTGSGNKIVQGAKTVIDGFNIGGFGIMLEQSSPTLSQNIVFGAPNGIAMAFGAAPIVNDSQISGANAGVLVSGPVQIVKVGPNRIEAKPTINRSVISGGNVGLLEGTGDGTLPTLVVNASTFSGSGGYAMNLYGNAQLTDCIVEKNGNGLAPAVLVGNAGDPGRTIVFERCKIRDNKGTGLVAAVTAGTQVILRHCEITGNDSPRPPGVNEGPHAGGVLVNNGGVQIIESKIVGNKTTAAGGGVYFQPFDSPTSQNLIVNSLIAGNSAGLHGGGIAAASQSFTVLNSTIAGNSAPAAGGVWLELLPFRPESTVRFANTAIVGNTAAVASAIAFQTYGDPSALFHDVVTLTADTYASSTNGAALPSPLGANGFSVPDAGFIAPASGDYRLAGSSPLIDRGDSAPISAYIASGGSATDLAGKPRIAGASVDVGAYEAVAAGVTDITSQVVLRQGGFVYDRATRNYTQNVTLANSSGGLLTGPISLVFDGLPAGVTVAAMTNVTVNQLPAGSPYLDVSSSDLVPGALLSLNLRFADPFNAAIRYTPRVLGGVGVR